MVSGMDGLNPNTAGSAGTAPASRVYTGSMPCRARAALLALSLLAVAFLAAPSLAAPAQEAVQALDLIKLQRLQQARDFETPTSDQGSVKLSDFRGKVVFLNFWATWCPPCKEEMPAMERLYRKYRAKGLVVLAVSMDSEGASVVVPFVKQHGLTFPVGLDRKGTVAGLYGVRAVPSTMIIDRQGNLALIALGPREWDGKPAQSLFESMLR